LTKKFNQATHGLASAFETVAKKLPEELKGDEAAAASKVMHQALQYVNNIIACFQTPSLAEMARSLKGARYCAYAAARMISQAKQQSHHAEE